MKFSVDQSVFSKSLLLAGKSLLAKSNLPVLSNVLVKAGKGEVEILSTSLETATRVVFNCKVGSIGETTINGRTVLEFVSQLPEGEVVFERLGEEVLLSAAGFKARMATIAAEEFPAIPKIEKGTKFSLSSPAFVRCVERVAFSAAMDEGRPVLTGVLFEASKGLLKLVATDGYRLSYDEIGLAGAEGASLTIIVPARALLEVAKILTETGEASREEGTFTMVVADNLAQVSFEIKGVEFTSRLIEGEYPGWQRVIPATFSTKVKVHREDLMRLVRVASIFAREAGSIAKVKVEPGSKGKGKLSLVAVAAQVGSSDAEVEVEVEGPGGEIAFNYRYLLDALNVIATDDVFFEMVESLNPGKISSTEPKDKFFHIVMPVRLQS